MALSVRQASRNASFDIAALAGIPRWNDHPVREMAQEILTPIFIASAYSTKLDELAAAVFNSNTTEIARLGFAVASIINNKAPEVKNLDKTTKEIASRIAKILQEAKNPLIISGTGSKSQELIQAAGNIGMALAASGKKANLSFVLPEANSMGLGMMEGGSLEEVIELVKGDKVKTLVILENDLYRRTDQNLLSCLSDKLCWITPKMPLPTKLTFFSLLPHLLNHAGLSLIMKAVHNDISAFSRQKRILKTAGNG
jgi:NADH-quinone oxidoreductase subunit G